MNVRPALRLLPLLFVGLASAILQASCARSSEDIPLDSEIFPAQHFRDYCIETRCPAPLATCPGDGRLCTVDLSRDVNHCGSCENRCPSPTPKMHGSYVCSEGECRFACAPFFADCNGDPADGCETSTSDDPANCGACGNACADGVICWRGACGCPNGFTQCGDDCKNLQTDVHNCGACGTECTAPPRDDPRWRCGPEVTPSNTSWQCTSASCMLLCKPGFGDCNDAFCSDGCEINLRNDPQNCGACGHACNPGQDCNEGTCECPEGTTKCHGVCVDLRNDPENCGDCGAQCAGPSNAGGGPTCQDGNCGYVCFPGWANCDKRLSNGCEADLTSSQRTCGSCDVECDIPAGQPCVAGKCLTRACEEPVVR